MNFKLFKAGVAALVLFVAPVAAEAADMQIRQPYYKGAPRSVVSYYNWTGFYVGATAGYGFGTSNWDIAGLEHITASPKGAVYGLTAGYNWQAGSFVYGIEGDYSLSSVKGSAPCFFGVSTCAVSNTWLATFRGRIGYAFDRFLPYVTAGGAYGNIKAHVDPANADASATKLGYTVGAGLEYAFLANWSAKIEYLYVNLGSMETGFAGGPPLAIPASFQENIIRVGLNYKFSGPLFSRF